MGSLAGAQYLFASAAPAHSKMPGGARYTSWLLYTPGPRRAQSPSRSCVIRSGSATVTALFTSHYGKLLFPPDEREASLTCVRAGTGAGGMREGGAESQGLDRCSKQRVPVIQLSGQCSDCKRSQELVAADSPGCGEAERDSLP